jgi:hypothetical protein
MTPFRAECPSYPVSIFIAGLAKDVGLRCRAYCDDVGFCVTVTETRYVYTGGFQFGVIVGLINYPRFPMTPETIRARAEELALLLIKWCKQDSATIQTPEMTYFISFRDQATPS